MIFDEAGLRALVADVVREVMAELLAAAPGRDEYMTVADAARTAAVAPGTIRAWVGDGRLGRYSAGRQLRIRRSELEAMMRAPTPSLATASDPVSIGLAIARRRAGVR